MALEVGTAGGSKGRFWRHDGSGWEYAGDLTGPAGAVGAAGSGFLSGGGAPAAALGNDGDKYLDTVTGIVYRKAAGAWTPSGETLRASRFRYVTSMQSQVTSRVRLLINGLPPGDLGDIGDTAIEIGASEGANGRYWHKTGDDTWSFGGDLTGATGPPGQGLPGPVGEP